MGLSRRDVILLSQSKTLTEATSFTDHSLPDRNSIHTLMTKCMKYLSYLFLPTDAEGVYRSFTENNIRNATIEGEIRDRIKASKTVSIEKETLQAVLCLSLSAAEMGKVLNSGEDEIAGRMSSLPTEYTSSLSMDSGSRSADDITSGNRNHYFKCHVHGCLLDVTGGEGGNGYWAQLFPV